MKRLTVNQRRWSSPKTQRIQDIISIDVAIPRILLICGVYGVKKHEDYHNL
jgi:ABC-type uncharacterized transport system YnjBCD permease subunit